MLSYCYKNKKKLNIFIFTKIIYFANLIIFLSLYSFFKNHFFYFYNHYHFPFYHKNLSIFQLKKFVLIQFSEVLFFKLR